MKITDLVLLLIIAASFAIVTFNQISVNKEQTKINKLFVQHIEMQAKLHSKPIDVDSSFPTFGPICPTNSSTQK